MAVEAQQGNRSGMGHDGRFHTRASLPASLAAELPIDAVRTASPVEGLLRPQNKASANDRFPEGVRVKLRSPEVSATRYVSGEEEPIVSLRYAIFGGQDKALFLRQLASTEAPSIRQTGEQNVLLPEMERLFGIIAPGLVVDARAVEFIDEVEAREGGKVLAQEMGKVGIEGKENAVEGVSAEIITVSDEALLTLSGELGGGRIRGGIVSAENVSGRVYLQGIKASQERKEKVNGVLTVGTVGETAAVSVGENSELVATTIAGYTYVDGTSASVVVDTVTGELKAAHGAKVKIGSGKVHVRDTAEINGEIKGPGEHSYGEVDPVGNGALGRDAMIDLIEGILRSSTIGVRKGADSTAVEPRVTQAPEPEVPVSIRSKVIGGKLREVRTYCVNGHTFDVIGRGEMHVTSTSDGGVVVVGEGVYRVDSDDNGGVKGHLNRKSATEADPKQEEASDALRAKALTRVRDVLRAPLEQAAEILRRPVGVVDRLVRARLLDVASGSEGAVLARRVAEGGTVAASAAEPARQLLRDVPDPLTAALRDGIPVDAVAQLDPGVIAAESSEPPTGNIWPLPERPTRLNGLGTPLVDMDALIASRPAGSTTTSVEVKPDFTPISDEEIDQRDREADIREAGRTVVYPETSRYHNPVGLVRRWGLGGDGIHTGNPLRDPQDLRLVDYEERTRGRDSLLALPVSAAGEPGVSQEQLDRVTAARWQGSKALVPVRVDSAAVLTGIDTTATRATVDERTIVPSVTVPEPAPVVQPDQDAVTPRGGLNVVFDIDQLSEGDSGAAQMMRDPDSGQAMPRKVRRASLPSFSTQVSQLWAPPSVVVQTPTAEVPVAETVELSLSAAHRRDIARAVTRFVDSRGETTTFRADEGPVMFGLPVGATVAEQEYITEAFIAGVAEARQALVNARRARDIAGLA
jgi:hypothetical protein